MTIGECFECKVPITTDMARVRLKFHGGLIVLLCEEHGIDYFHQNWKRTIHASFTTRDTHGNILVRYRILPWWKRLLTGKLLERVKE